MENLVTWPICYTDQLIIGDPSSDTAIVCCWSVKERVAKLAKELGIAYNTIGNLYSQTRGLSPFLRNLAANPTIKKIFVIGPDLTLTGQSLSFLFGKISVDKADLLTIGANTYYKTPYGGLVDFDIAVVLTMITKHRTIKIYTDQPVDKSLLWIKDQVIDDPGQPIKVYLPEPVKEDIPNYPANYTGHLIRANSLSEAWVRVMHDVLTFGKTSDTQYGSQKELRSVVSVITKIDDTDLYRLNDSYLATVTEQQFQNYYRTNFATSDLIIDAAYTYGNRIRRHDQLTDLCHKLVTDPDTRAAVISLWDYCTDAKKLANNPCLTQLSFRLFEQKLFVTAIFRSHDVWSAYRLNLISIWTLANEVLNVLSTNGVQVTGLGDLTVISDSAHIYQAAEESAKSVVQTYLTNSAICERPSQVWDAKGKFIFSIEDGQIVVNMIAPEEVGGYTIRTWKAHNASTISETLANENLIGSIAHAIYVGKQLQKAETCIRNGEPYHQE